MKGFKNRFRQWTCGVFMRHPYRDTILKNNTNLLTDDPDIVSETCMRCRRRLQ